MSPELSSYEDRTLYSTWQISYERVERRNPLSAQLLRLWAYFDNQDVWFELLYNSDSKDPDWIRELIKDEFSFHGAMRILSDHGLVEIDKSSQELLESRGYSIHGCVHSWTVHVLNQKWNYDLARVALNSVASHVPREQAVRPWLTQRRLLQHAARCSYIVLNNLVRYNGIEWAYHQLGVLYKDQGKLAEAEQMYERALQGTEKALGAEHVSTLSTVNNLGTVYQNQGKLAEAEQMYERALQGTEKALGAEHVSTLSTVNNLGTVYQNQGKLAEAEQMYERALQGYEKALGINNITTYIPALNTLWAFGSLLKCQADFKKARVIYLKALAGYQKVVGPEHPYCQSLQEIIQDLETIIEREAVKGREELVSDPQGNVSRLDSEKALLTSRRNRLFRKLGLR